MNIRIKEYPKGFVAEIQNKTWYGRKYWTHFVSVSGMRDEPWCHSERKYAEMSIIDKIKNLIKQNNND